MKRSDRYWAELIAVISVTVTLGYVFVWRRNDLIANLPCFLALVLGLIMLSFILTATEAAFSVAGKDKKVTGKIDELVIKRTTSLATADANVVASRPEDSRRLRREQRTAYKAFNRAKRTERNIIGSGRIHVVGALSALNVLISTALVTFLPTFITNSGQGSDAGVALLPPDKLLILVASALPILYFGKIVPKMVGLQYPYSWGYNLYSIGNAADRVIGWVPRGLACGLAQTRLMKPLD